MRKAVTQMPGRGSVASEASSRGAQQLSRVPRCRPRQPRRGHDWAWTSARFSIHLADCRWRGRARGRVQVEVRASRHCAARRFLAVQRRPGARWRGVPAGDEHLLGFTGESGRCGAAAAGRMQPTVRDRCVFRDITGRRHGHPLRPCRLAGPGHCGLTSGRYGHRDLGVAARAALGAGRTGAVTEQRQLGAAGGGTFAQEPGHQLVSPADRLLPARGGRRVMVRSCPGPG